MYYAWIRINSWRKIKNRMILVINFFQSSEGQIWLSGAGVGATLSRLFLPGAGVGSRTLGLPEPPKKVAAPQHCFILTSYPFWVYCQYFSKPTSCVFGTGWPLMCLRTFLGQWKTSLLLPGVSAGFFLKGNWHLTFEPQSNLDDFLQPSPPPHPPAYQRRGPLGSDCLQCGSLNCFLK